MSAKKSIREFCLWCMMNSYTEIKKCPSEDCPIWEFREGFTYKGCSKQKACKLKCQDCMQTLQTGKCKEKKCPLFPYREGKRPVSEDHVKRIISPEQIAKMRAGLPQKKRKFWHINNLFP